MDYKTELIKQLEELEAENTQHPSFYDGYGFAISDAIETIKKFNYIPCCTTLPTKEEIILQARKVENYIGDEMPIVGAEKSGKFHGFLEGVEWLSNRQK